MPNDIPIAHKLVVPRRRSVQRVAWLVLIGMGLAGGCTLARVGPSRIAILGNGHVTVCETQGVVRHVRPDVVAGTEEAPTSPETADVAVDGPCTVVTGGASSSNLVLMAGILIAGLATIAALVF